MHRSTLTLGFALGLALLMTPSRAQAQTSPTAGDRGALVGEIRLIAVDPRNADAVQQLREQGWIETDGRLLKQDEFPALYAHIGRGWTPKQSAANVFAVPNLVDRTDATRNPDPYGVLGGDVVTSGRGVPRPSGLRYFIYGGAHAE